MGDGRAAQNRNIQSEKPEVDAASGLWRSHPPGYLGLPLPYLCLVAEGQAGTMTDIDSQQRFY